MTDSEKLDLFRWARERSPGKPLFVRRQFPELRGLKRKDYFRLRARKVRGGLKVCKRPELAGVQRGRSYSAKWKRLTGYNEQRRKITV